MPSGEELTQNLTSKEYAVLRKGDTEAPFTGEYVDTSEEGVYRCKVCGNVLFTSAQKFDSSTGWPSFTNPAVAENVGTRVDNTHGMRRSEVYCKHCMSHLGHVFDDGPAEEGGKRYCINSICLAFEECPLPNSSKHGG